ncbi:MAG TPA: SH3 domain-containing protein [Candidatus Nanoarchaeia archaeon]|nr:hypothetical protein [uncultured archaeon]
METASSPQEPKPRLKKLLIFSAVVILGLLLISAVYFLFIQEGSPKTRDKEQKIATQEAQSKTESKFSLGYVTAQEGLNLREEPSLEANIILLLPYGTQVEIVATEEAWYLINANAQGFVAKEFIASTKPPGTALKVFKEEGSPFNFLYPEIYQVSLKQTDNVYEYYFTGGDSFGGFRVEAEDGFATIGNYALKNYPGSAKGSCAVQFAASRKECEQLQTANGTLYLVLFKTTLHKISYLKTEGGVLTDINNLVFYSLVVR